jgi:hypothetical protein
MKNLIAVVIPAILLLVACGNDETQSTVQSEPGETGGSVDASAALAELVETFFERGLQRNPLRATFIGDYRYDDRLANTISPEYIAESRAIDREYLDRTDQSIPFLPKFVYSAWKWFRSASIQDGG